MAARGSDYAIVSRTGAARRPCDIVSYTALPGWVARSDAERAWQCTGALEQSRDCSAATCTSCAGAKPGELEQLGCSF